MKVSKITSKINSSCKCIINCTCDLRESWLITLSILIIAIFVTSAALPWIVVLIACRSA